MSMLAPPAGRPRRAGRRRVARWATVGVALALAGSSACGSPASTPSTAMVAVRADTAGPLPPDGTSTLAGVALPAGRATTAGPGTIWLTDDVVDDRGRLWMDLRRVYPSTGLWPVIFRPLRFAQVDWWSDLPATRGTDPSAVTPEQVLRSLWRDIVLTGVIDVATLSPFGVEFPGLAPMPPGPVVDDAAADLARYTPGRLALVPVSRPADAAMAMGWFAEGTDADVGEITSVIRSWEDRFGVLLVVISIDDLAFAVRNPPRTAGDAARAAAELTALCPEILFFPHRDVAAFSRDVRGSTSWICTWAD